MDDVLPINLLPERNEVEKEESNIKCEGFFPYESPPERTLSSSQFAASYGLEKFSGSLINGNLFDNRSMDFTGSTLSLPNGVELLNQLRKIVRKNYGNRGLLEYEFPRLTNQAIYEPTKKILNLENKLLHIGKDKDFLHGTPLGTLSPTGEAMIYTYWSKKIRTLDDLPEKMWRQATYSRPAPRGKGSGSGIFSSMEAEDIFEFHCAFANEKEALTSIVEYRDMLGKIMSSIQLPVIWSLRPPWTNRSEVSEWTLGGDLPLPTGETIQVSGIYNQGKNFSGPYDVSFKVDGHKQYTHQICGFTSRRILYGHLLLGAGACKDFFISPALAPNQLSIIISASGSHSEENLSKFLSELESSSLRYKICRISEKKELIQRRKRNLGDHVPVEILIITPDGEKKPNYKIIIRLLPLREERILLLQNLDALQSMADEVIAFVEERYKNAIAKYYASRIHDTSSKTGMLEILNNRLVALVPLDASRQSVRVLESLSAGEVLGFVKNHHSEACIITGKKCVSLAYISPRK